MNQPRRGWSQYSYGPHDRYQYGPMDRFQHGPYDRFQHGPHNRIQRRDDPGQSHSQDTSQSATTPQGVLLAPNQFSESNASEADKDWISLINPHLTQEERDELSSVGSDSEVEEPELEAVSEEIQSLAT